MRPVWQNSMVSKYVCMVCVQSWVLSWYSILPITEECLTFKYLGYKLNSHIRICSHVLLWKQYHPLLSFNTRKNHWHAHLSSKQMSWCGWYICFVIVQILHDIIWTQQINLAFGDKWFFHYRFFLLSLQGFLPNQIGTINSRYVFLSHLADI